MVISVLTPYIEVIHQANLSGRVVLVNHKPKPKINTLLKILVRPLSNLTLL
jgi:hypothetical protein